MIDERELVERAIQVLVREDPSFNDLIKRRDRKRRNQRITAGVVGIAVFVAAIWLVVGAGSPHSTPQPATQPNPTPKPEVKTVVPEVTTALPGWPGADNGVDSRLDLDTGTLTSLPESMTGVWRNGYAISPDGSEVAYYGRAEDSSAGVFVATLDGTRTRRIASNLHLGWGGGKGSPGWSPDGTQIAYVGHPEGGGASNIFVVDVGNGVTKQVTFETDDVSGTQFSPDGSSIIYTSRTDVRIVPVSGGKGSTLLRGGNGVFAGSAFLSPDGSLLAYTCNRRTQSAEDDLCVANADGSDPKVIAEGSAAQWIPDASWSPDGTRLAYWEFHTWDVYVVEIATGQATLVGRGAWPTWIDDHTLIVEPYYGPR